MPPITPSLLGLLRTCGLRAAFNASPGYPRRSLPFRRIGTAVHYALQDLAATDSARTSAEEFARIGLAMFRRHLDEERKAASTSARERDFRWSQDRVQLAENAVIIAARRIWDGAARRPIGIFSMVEHRLQSPDGLLAGVPDRLDRVQSGTRIVEYKAHAAPSDEDIAEHTGQLLFYAYLAFEIYGEWPKETVLSYVVAGRNVHVPVDPERCVAIGQEARLLAHSLVETPGGALAPNPGPSCADCEYRPWCRPFWSYQAERFASNPLNASTERGIEGSVSEVRGNADAVFLELHSDGRELIARMPLSRFWHLRDVQLGARLRFLDVQITGPADRRTIMSRDYTEVYRVVLD